MGRNRKPRLDDGEYRLARARASSTEDVRFARAAHQLYTKRSGTTPWRSAPMRRVCFVFAVASVLVASALVAAALTSPAAALAAARERLEYDLQFEGVVDCGTFVDNFTDFFHVSETDEFGADGNLVRVLLHVEHHSNDVNSVTGFTIHEHGHFYVVEDLVAGTTTITGNSELANRKGTGVVVQDTGRIVLDANGDPIFFAGGRKHSNNVQGEQIYCDALS